MGDSVPTGMADAPAVAPAPPPPVPKQAVVVIHGMGEQKPLDTLRSFVEAVYQHDPGQRGSDPQAEADDPELGEVNRVWIVPDDATGSAELRRITTPKNANGVRTDFFEFYWADIMEGTALDQVYAWVEHLLLRSPFALPPHAKIRLAWVALWVVTLIFVLASVFVAKPDLFGAWSKAPLDWIAAHAAGVGLMLIGLGALWLVWRFARGLPPAQVKVVVPAALILVGLVVAGLGANLANAQLWAAALAIVIAMILNTFIGPYAGDIARYVRAAPQTVEKRAAIRDRGLKLLEALHGNGDAPPYDRIIVVAHSLGCMIGYDLIQLYWEKHGPTHKQPGQPSAALKAALEDVDRYVQQVWHDPGGPLTGDTSVFELAAYQAAQARLFDELAASGNWRISDFVTMGNPLAHAEFLLFDDDEALARAFEERLLAASPPRPDRPSRSMLYYEGWDGDKTQRRGPFAHFAAAFAAVRWTNICDDNAFPAIGDVISGEVTGYFGPGVAEHGVKLGWPHLPPGLRRLITHTLYWTWPSAQRWPPPRHIELLREAIGLTNNVARNVARRRSRARGQQDVR